eukprot:GEMP01025997.1.p1 GENE.GEMP01025997.1~~GEMP01025997.1.p1  ORF type:complete len:343 (+),score=95.34 GEMP01025997.1:68-1096(+)
MEARKKPLDVVVHPIVLLSVVDHYNRLAKGTSKRVIGSLLGEIDDNKLHVTNCFAVPFDEEPRDGNLWFVDSNYHDVMFHMFKKVNTKERVVGWYSTGPKIRPSDLHIHEVFRQSCPEPIFVIIDVRMQNSQLPLDAYYSVEQATADMSFRRNFVNIPSTVGAEEAEEVGVEHLLRDIKSASTSTLATRVGDKINGLKQLMAKLKDISNYLSSVVSGKIPPNPTIIYNVQNILNLLPEMDSEDLVKGLNVDTNDATLAMYIGAMMRATLALHNLIYNIHKIKEDGEEKEKKDEKKEDEKKEDEKKDDEKKEGGKEDSEDKKDAEKKEDVKKKDVKKEDVKKK